jgi:signal transduction histidine kinase
MSIDESIAFSCYIDDVEMFGHKSELVQALLIVINNAVDACRDNHHSSKIGITITSVSNNIVIEVEDNGGGISKEIIKDIFNTYFTTKHESEGTGLGLYILKMIVEGSMFGKVAVENARDGAVFRMILPVNLEKRKIK